MTTPATQAKPPAVQPQQLPAAPATTGQPIKVIVEKVPDDKHDYGADLITGSIGIAGALIGAWAGAMVTAAIARKQKQGEERERDDMAIVSLFRVITKAYTFTTGYVADVNTAVAAHKEGKAQFVSAALQPYANYPNRVTITGEEIYRAKRVGGYQFSNMVVDLDDRFNAILEMATMYRTLRTQAMSLLKVESNNGTAVVGSADKENEALIKAEFASLDNMIGQSLEISDDLRKDAYHAMIRCVECIVEYFQRDQKIETVDLDGKPQVIELKATPKK